MLARGLTLATFIVAAWSSVSFVGYPNGGNITVTCETQLTFPVGNYFTQSCIANNCIAPVTFTWSPDLTQYGFSLNTVNPAKILINPNADAIAQGSLSTTITANDSDGPSATGLVNFIFNCPLSLARPIPDQDITEAVLWSLNVATYFNNPARHTLTWQLNGFANTSAIKISSAGLISGIPAVMDATAAQPILATIVVNDTATSQSVTSNVFKVRVTPLPGISFPSALGPIPSQNATEGVLYSLSTARYFSNPSNFRVTWSLSSSLAGFAIDQTTGIISITPGATELLATRLQPATIIISGVDERGNLATSNTATFTVLPAKLQSLPVPSPLPSLNCGSFCCGWNVADYVNNPSSNAATYTLVSGLPAGSAIQLSSNGTFSGLASMVDVRASPITLRVQVNNGDPAGPITLPAFTFSVVGLAAPTISGMALPVRTIQVGTFFSLDTKPYFTLPAGSVANWTLVGSPSLSIDFNGKVTGTLQDSDYTNSPTLTFNVTVSNRGTCGGGSVSQLFQFTIDPNWQGPSCSVSTQADITVCERTTFPYRNFSALCRDPKNSALTYSIIGLPNNTGLTFDAATGTLRGTVSTTAADNPATSVQICAMNEHALQACSAPFQINFQRAKRPPIADPPIPSPVTAILGQRFVGYFNFHFYEPDWQPLIYSVAGLPVGSGLGIGPITGIFSGTPNMADFRASPLVLSVFASNEQNVNRNTACASQGQGGRARADLIIIIERPPSLPICMPIPSDNAPAQIGMFWARDVSASFQPGEGATKLEYALRSLPRGSGLSIDPRSGVVSGVLSQQDLTSSPLTIVVAATNGYGSCQSNFQLNVVPRMRQPVLQPTPVARPTIGGRPGVNPCDRNNGGCAQVCQNQNGLAVCSCPPNWFLNSDRLSCGYDPCGSNNGGCEQLCTASGNQAKCDCRVGTLNADRRTCGSQIIVVGTVPPGLVLGCQYFMFDFSTAFSHAGGKPLTFRLSGLSPQTGFAISSGGLLSGTPTDADCASAQPMTLTVTATDGVASVQAVMFLSAFCDNSCKSKGQIGGGTSTNLPAATPASSIPLMWAWVCREFNFDLSRYFIGGQGSVTFSALGLPQGTGFQMATQGVLQGTPNSVDCARSPLTVTIIARDSAGRESKAVVTIKFSSCGCVQNPSFKGSSTTILPSFSSTTILPSYSSTTILPSYPALPSWPSTTILPASPILPVSQTILPSISTSTTTPSLHTHAVAECGQPFFLDSSEYFRVNNLNYKLSGLPPGTGLRLSDSGVLSGTPNSIDARSVNPLVGAIVGTDRTGASVTLVVDIEIKGDCGSIPPPSNQFVTNYRSGFALAPGDSNTGILPVQNAVARQFFRLDLSRVAFSGLRGKLRYEASGLPSSSGLSLTSAGVLSGIPSAQSCSDKPVPLTVTAIRDSERANATLYIKFSCDAQASVLTGGSQLPTITGVVGELLYYDCAPYMTSQSSNVTFSVAGLDSASSLRMSASGVLSGVPSAIDVKGPSLLVTARDAAGREVQNTVRLNVVAQANANHPPTFIPLETVHTAGDQPFSVNMRQRFYDEDGDNITLAVVGLSNQSGIKFDAVTGVLSGTPSSYDLKASQPVVFTTLANDGNGGRTEGSVYVFFVSGNQRVTSQNVTLPVASSTHQNRDPISLSIKRQVGIEGVPFLFGVASSFVDQDGDVLTYSLDGLPRDTGLAIDRSSGVIAGTPSRADAEALQPISITVSVTDGQGGSCAQIFLLTVFQGEETSNHEPDARAIADVKAYVGDKVLLRLSSNFADSDGDALTYDVTGLPAGTGFQLLASSGIFVGTPNSQDQAASPLSLVIHVDDGRGGEAKSSFKLTVSPSSQKPATQPESTQPREVLKKVSPSGVVSIQFEVGKPGFFASASLFPTHLTSFTISGLPVGTGLTMDRKTGVLSGSPTLEDVIATDSLAFRLLPLTISTTGKSGANMTQVVMLSLISSSDAANHAPFARIIPKSQAFPGHEFLLNIWGSFVDPDGDNLVFSVIGLPAKSGFQIEPKQGLFFGMPSEADITAPQPLVLTIVADDQKGGKAQENLLLTVSESSSRVKSCRQLGWPVVPGSSLCARAPKVLDGCLSTITFADAQKYCSALGARLCSSQELSDPRFSDSTGDECDVKNMRVWTSSWCADSEVITQASTSDALGSAPKECSAQESRAAMLKCCANSDETGPKAFGEVIAASEKTCEQLPSFVTAASSPNKAVCSSSLVQQKVGKRAGVCSGDVTFDVAKDMCARRGARLCTADELSQDVGADQVCGYSSKRMWTASQCPFEGQVLTQAGSSAFLRSVPKQCTKTTATLPVYCCADQKRDQYFQNLAVNATSREISLTWNWRVFPHAQVSLRKASASKGNVVWVTPQSAKDVTMGGDASVSLSSLEATTRYAIRITPLNEDQKLVKSQAVEFRVSTT